MAYERLPEGLCATFEAFAQGVAREKGSYLKGILEGYFVPEEVMGLFDLSVEDERVWDSPQTAGVVKGNDMARDLIASVVNGAADFLDLVAQDIRAGREPLPEVQKFLLDGKWPVFALPDDDDLYDELEEIRQDISCRYGDIDVDVKGALGEDGLDKLSWQRMVNLRGPGLVEMCGGLATRLRIDPIGSLDVFDELTVEAVDEARESVAMKAICDGYLASFSDLVIKRTQGQGHGGARH